MGKGFENAEISNMRRQNVKNTEGGHLRQNARFVDKTR
jgi:hypothetical protein